MQVAVKCLRITKVNKRELTKFKAELIIMCPLHHPNLVKLYGGIWNEGADNLCIVLEFCPHGSLKTYLGAEFKNVDEKLIQTKAANTGTWKELRHGLALGVAKCLSYLHHDLNETLIHRDMKPDNVLVGEDIVAKVADFGESRHFDTKHAKEEADDDGDDALSMTMVGTKLYCAPEIMMRQRYNESAVSNISNVISVFMLMT